MLYDKREYFLKRQPNYEARRADIAQWAAEVWRLLTMLRCYNELLSYQLLPVHAPAA
jgi:hypothetical protein